MDIQVGGGLSETSSTFRKPPASIYQAPDLLSLDYAEVAGILTNRPLQIRWRRRVHPTAAVPPKRLLQVG